MDKVLYILRHVPGAGSSTLAKQLTEHVFEADQYFLSEGQYKFNPAELASAHNSCKIRLISAMRDGITPLCVSNTTTTEKELTPYLEYAKAYGYKAFVLVVENRHNGVNEHNVPEEVLGKMKARLMGSIKL
jgi:hypothetical protein